MCCPTTPRPAGPCTRPPSSRDGGERHAFALVALISLAGEGALEARRARPAAGRVRQRRPAGAHPARRGRQDRPLRPLATVLDAAIDDFGADGNADALAVYRVPNKP